MDAKWELPRSGGRLELEDEIAVLRRPAKIRYRIGSSVRLEIEAVIEPQKGSDGAMYPAVSFRIIADNLS